MATFIARGDVIDVHLSDADRGLLARIPEILVVVDTDPDDPGHAVLHRAAYRDDAAAAERFDAIIDGERAAGRAIDRAVVDAVATGADSITRMEALSLLRSVNEARLALAARSGAFDDGPGWERRVATDPRVAAVVWLARIQSELLAAVSRLQG